MTDGLHAAILEDRAVLRISGEDAATFLQGLVTSDVASLDQGKAAFSALLTPQGKILADFFLIRTADGFALDCRKDEAEALLKRLGFYKLRAKVELQDAQAAECVLAYWGGGRPPAGAYADPRLGELGWRAVTGREDAPDMLAADGMIASGEAAYHAHRIALGVPEGGVDFAFGETFPHEADMDQLAGISMSKGCYIGQEVVSRMEHRGTTRNRIVGVRIEGGRPAPGSEIRAGDLPVGTLGSSSGALGVAMIRLDRASAAAERGDTLQAGASTLHLAIPEWASFTAGGN